jgi:hypothetical protein
MSNQKNIFYFKSFSLGILTFAAPALLMIVFGFKDMTKDLFYTVLGILSLAAGIVWRQIYFPTETINNPKNGKLLAFIFTWAIAPIFGSVISVATYLGVYFWNDDPKQFWNWIILIIFLNLTMIKVLRTVWNYRINLPKK